MKKQLRNALYGVALFLSGCASISSPEGGAKDLTAPKLVSSNPKNGQTNVKPEKIEMIFDEAVQLEDLTRQLLIAPFTEATYKTKVKDRTVELTFSEPLLDNTTYSLNFRKSVVDITEKNPVANLVITFATGDFLDSGSVAGNVGYLFSNNPPKEANLLLYPTNDTSQVTKGRPLYVTQADSSGNFAFSNVKQGNYYIYALAETNNNLRYDSEKESIAYTTDSIQVKPRVTGLQLKLHTQDGTKPNVLTRKGYTNLYEVTYNEGIAKATVTGLDHKTEIKWLLDNTGKTLRLFPAAPEERRWLITAQDSANNIKVDTIAVRLTGTAAARKNNGFTVANGTTIKPGEDIRLTFEVPTKILDPIGAFSFLLDSTTIVATKEAKELQVSPDGTQITLKYPAGAKKEFSVTLDSTKVLPYIGGPYNKSTAKVEVSDKATTGSLTVKLATKQKNYFVQLLRDGKMVREVKNQPTILWENLEPGTYSLRILVDTNGNGKWDNGLLKERRLPEPVVLPPDVLEIRSNWEIETSPIQF